MDKDAKESQPEDAKRPGDPRRDPFALSKARVRSFSEAGAKSGEDPQVRCAAAMGGAGGGGRRGHEEGMRQAWPSLGPRRYAGRQCAGTDTCARQDQTLCAVTMNSCAACMHASMEGCPLSVCLPCVPAPTPPQEFRNKSLARSATYTVATAVRCGTTRPAPPCTALHAALHRVHARMAQLSCWPHAGTA